MPTDRDHLIYLGDHLGIGKGHCSILSAYLHCEYLLSLRLITLASNYRSTIQAYDLRPRPRPQCTVTTYQSPASVSRPYCRIADRNKQDIYTTGS
ncbi:hypothetical protein CKAH01_13094 [Colletotrichum kahawae]|uniref:Uncharacterized protein n=1 Tax=Colletotrichum kahawae TaxID=34407 RepID=A0AAE0DAE0_COLKA|nr:hypothetical protein CKAH01_13094 [Colletotrichum kahawae]